MRIIYTISFAFLLLFSSCTSKLYKDKLGINKSQYNKMMQSVIEKLFIYSEVNGFKYCIEENVILRNDSILNINMLSVKESYIRKLTKGVVKGDPFDIKEGMFLLPPNINSIFNKVKRPNGIYNLKDECDVTYYISPVFKTNVKNKYIVQVFFLGNPTNQDPVEDLDNESSAIIILYEVEFDKDYHIINSFFESASATFIKLKETVH